MWRKEGSGVIYAQFKFRPDMCMKYVESGMVSGHLKRSGNSAFFKH